MTSVADWTPAAAAEPDVVVGVVLPGDGATQLRLVVPDVAWDLDGSGNARARPRASAVDFRLTDGGVEAAVGGRPSGKGSTWALRPRGPAAGPNAPAVRVERVVAGRGFHWETETEQLLPGELSVRAVGGRLLLTCRLPLEEYLAGVVTSEMSGDCPIEFLMSQCVVARSWTLAAAERKHADLGIDLCNDDCCQRYQGVGGVTEAARSAVARTRGLALVTEAGEVVDANYSKCCGGIVEDPEHVWGRPKPGLSALVDAPSTSPMHHLLPVNSENFAEYLAQPQAHCNLSSMGDEVLSQYLGRVDCGGGLYRWAVSYDRAELEDILRRKGNAPAEMVELLDVQVVRRGVSGRATEVSLVYRTPTAAPAAAAISGQHGIRGALHPEFLYSSAFSVAVERDVDGRAIRFRFEGAGWGHGAGLCQIGALSLALAGHDHRAILVHYFPTARLAMVYG